MSFASAPDAIVSSDEFHIRMPSGRRFDAKIETPLTLADKHMLHKLIDLVLDETMEQQGRQYPEEASHANP